MKIIRIEEVGDINFDYPYLEIFFNESKTPFLEVSISEEEQLVFKFYSSKKDIILNIEEWEQILHKSKEFLLNALKNEATFINFISPLMV